MQCGPELTQGEAFRGIGVGIQFDSFDFIGEEGDQLAVAGWHLEVHGVFLSEVFRREQVIDVRTCGVRQAERGGVVVWRGEECGEGGLSEGEGELLECAGEDVSGVAWRERCALHGFEQFEEVGGSFTGRGAEPAMGLFNSMNFPAPRSCCHQTGMAVARVGVALLLRLVSAGMGLCARAVSSGSAVADIFRRGGGPLNRGTCGAAESIGEQLRLQAVGIGFETWQGFNDNESALGGESIQGAEGGFGEHGGGRHERNFESGEVDVS